MKLKMLNKKYYNGFKLIVESGDLKRINHRNFSIVSSKL